MVYADSIVIDFLMEKYKDVQSLKEMKDITNSKLAVALTVLKMDLNAKASDD